MKMKSLFLAVAAASLLCSVPFAVQAAPAAIEGCAWVSNEGGRDQAEGGNVSLTLWGCWAGGELLHTEAEVSVSLNSGVKECGGNFTESRRGNRYEVDVTVVFCDIRTNHGMGEASARGAF